MSENNSKAVLKKIKPKKSHVLRIVVLVLVLFVGVFAVATIPSLWKSSEEEPPEIVTVELKGDTIVVNKDKVYTLEALREYFDTLKEAGDMPGMALICDSANPPTQALYNDVIKLMSEYGIIPDNQHKDMVRLPMASSDEAGATFDETV